MAVIVNHTHADLFRNLFTPVQRMSLVQILECMKTAGLDPQIPKSLTHPGCLHTVDTTTRPMAGVSTAV
jgi:hypothetical protein